MMKQSKISKSILMAVFLAMAVLVMANLSSARDTFPQIRVSLINQEPDPVAPGNTFEVRFRIENEGSDIAQNMEVKVLPKYPFSLYGDEEESKRIGTIASYQTGDAGVKEKWRLFVDPGAATGDNNLEFWYKTLNGVWTKAGEYAVTIKTRDAVLAINTIKTEPESMVPGTKTKVTFVLENLAYNSLTDIKLNLGILTEVSTATAVTYRELPFTPIGSGNEKTLQRLGIGETSRIFFDLFTDADATSKVYKVPYTLTYSDASGTNFTRTGIVGFLVESDPDISVNIDRTEIYQAGAKGVVEIKIVNKGFSDIKFLDIQLLEGSGYQILSNHEVYIGELDSDDYETAEYTLLVDKDAGDKVTLPLKMEYRDANGHLFEKEIPLELKLYSGSELKQRTNGNSSPLSWLIPVVLIIIVGVIIYRKVKKGKKKKD